MIKNFLELHSFLLIHVYNRHLNVLYDQSWGEGLTQLFGLLGILDNKGVQVARASDLELDILGILLNASGLGVLSAGNLKEVLDVLNLLRLFGRKSGAMSVFSKNQRIGRG